MQTGCCIQKEPANQLFCMFTTIHHKGGMPMREFILSLLASVLATLIVDAIKSHKGPK